MKRKQTSAAEAEERGVTRLRPEAGRLEILGRLAMGVAHDVNNVLAAILGHAALAQERAPAGSPARAALEEIARLAQGAADLSRQVLAFGQPSVPSVGRVDLNALVGATARMAKRLLGDRVSLVTELDPALPPVRGDAGRLEQVLLNLVLNARDAMPLGGLLAVRTRTVHVDACADGPVPPGRYALLVVADSGTGMTPAVRRHCFEPFFTTKPPGRGTGLGLANVVRTVEEHGGGIDLESEPGHGTTFRVWLPAPDPDRTSDGTGAA